MSNVNLFLLATTIGLGLALYHKSKPSSSSSGDSSSKISTTTGGGKKNNKKKKKASAASASSATATGASETESEKVPSSPPPQSQQHQNGHVKGEAFASVAAKPPASATNGHANGAVKKGNKAQRQQQQQQSVPVTANVEREAPLQSVEPHANGEEKGSSPWTNDELRRKLQAGTEAFHSQLDDMRDEDVDPTPHYNHVARIPAPAEKGPRAVRLTQKDRDDGWESVAGNARPRQQPGTSNATNSFASIASTNPFAALPTEVSSSKVKTLSSSSSASSKPSASTSASSSSWTLAGGKSRPSTNGGGSKTAEQTKKQRQNAAKTAAKRQAKEDEERARLDKLALYRKEQEREKIRNLPLPSQAKGGANKGGKAPMPKAAVAENGALVWD